MRSWVERLLTRQRRRDDVIGVTARHAHREAIAELFELFKTPWEWLIPGKRYRAVILADGETVPTNAEVALVYSSSEHPVDRLLRIAVRAGDGPGRVRWGDRDVPLYGDHVLFQCDRPACLLTNAAGAIDYSRVGETVTVQRFGYDLGAEIAQLQTQGQLSTDAHIPTLELHIALIRACLDRAAVRYVEVPPRPNGIPFLCCLTHDVDFFGIRRHSADRTLAGFIWRGTVGTLYDLARGERTLIEALRNWHAVASLPLVFMGIKRDFWNPFRDYADADAGRPSTFFLIPFKNRPGITPDGATNNRRGVSYGIDDVGDEMRSVETTQTELAVHGIDAWCDADAGQREKSALTRVTGQAASGIRMHWLYFSSESPQRLAEAGFDYDSTWGYNEAVGFRAGTLQVFQLPGTRLLEIPLTIMDSALFYPTRLGLTRAQAAERCGTIIEAAKQFGGVLVLNWHDRSLAPERQWGRFYQELLTEIDAIGGRYMTAADAVDWFRWRRSIRFATRDGDTIVDVAAPQLRRGLPAACVMTHGGHDAEVRPFFGGTRSLTLQ